MKTAKLCLCENTAGILFPFGASMPIILKKKTNPLSQSSENASYFGATLSSLFRNIFVLEGEKVSRFIKPSG